MNLCLIYFRDLPWKCVPAATGIEAVQRAHPTGQYFKLIRVEGLRAEDVVAVGMTCTAMAAAATDAAIHVECGASQLHARALGR